MSATWLDPAVQAAKTDATPALRSVAALMAGDMTAIEVAEATGQDADCVRNHLRAAVAVGLAEEVGRRTQPGSRGPRPMVFRLVRVTP